MMALLICCCALACGDLIEGALLPLHRWMASFLDPRSGQVPISE
jgi:hypothetical protein